VGRLITLVALLSADGPPSGPVIIWTSDFANRAIRSRQPALNGADVRAYFSSQSCAVPPGAHIAFVERPQEDATINRMEKQAPDRLQGV
jgi:hypothetical protein